MTRTTRCTRPAASAGQRSRTLGPARFLGQLWLTWDVLDACSGLHGGLMLCLLDDDLSCWCRAWIRAGRVAQ